MTLGLYDLVHGYPMLICGVSVTRQGYTAGFAFYGSRVLLIEKKRGPEAFRGLWNGIGGKLVLGEHVDDCQRREFREETGVDIPTSRWTHTIRLTGSSWVVWFFRTDLTLEEAARAHTAEDETVAWFEIADLPRLAVVPNLHWLVPLSNDRSLGGYPINIREAA